MSDIYEKLITAIDAETYFLEVYLEKHPETDMAGVGLRSSFLLFSFYWEFILKALYAKTMHFNDENELIKKLIELNHKLDAIVKDIKKEYLEEAGTKNVLRNNDGYDVKLADNRIITVKDFTAIRYDFLEGKIRKITKKENKEMLSAIEDMRIIINKIKPLKI